MQGARHITDLGTLGQFRSTFDHTAREFGVASMRTSNEAARGRVTTIQKWPQSIWSMQDLLGIPRTPRPCGTAAILHEAKNRGIAHLASLASAELADSRNLILAEGTIDQECVEKQRAIFRDTALRGGGLFQDRRPPLYLERIENCHFYMDGSRFFILKNNKIHPASSLIPGPQQVCDANHGHASPLTTLCFIGDEFEAQNPAHFVLDWLVRAQFILGALPAHADAYFCADPVSPLCRVGLAAVLPKARLLQMKTMYFVSELYLLSSSRSDHPHGHPAWYRTREILLPIRDCLRKHAESTCVPPAPRLYFSRACVQGRKLSNEAELESALQARSFSTVDMGSMAGTTQVKLAMQADRIIGPHGAALTNVLFAPTTAKVIELFHPLKGSLAFANLCAALGLEYCPVIGQAQPENALSYSVNIASVLAHT